MKYVIKPEIMAGDMYYMIYAKSLFGLFNIFIERWNTKESAEERVNALNRK